MCTGVAANEFGIVVRRGLAFAHIMPQLRFLLRQMSVAGVNLPPSAAWHTYFVRNKVVNLLEGVFLGIYMYEYNSDEGNILSNLCSTIGADSCWVVRENSL